MLNSQSSRIHVFFIQTRVYTRRLKKIVTRGTATPIAIKFARAKDSGWSKLEVSPGGGGSTGVGFVFAVAILPSLKQVISVDIKCKCKLRPIERVQDLDIMSISKPCSRTFKNNDGNEVAFTSAK
jgi:hypothetical protein